MSGWHWSHDTNVERVFNDPNLITCRLRWTEREPGTVKGVWQITSFEPPLSASNWENPPGLLQSGELPVNYEQTADVSHDVPGGTAAVALSPGLLTGTSGTEPPKRSVRVEGAQANYAKLIETDIYEISFAPPNLPRLKGSETSWQTVYIRIVAIDSRGNVVGMPSNQIRLTIHNKQPVQLAPPTSEELAADKLAEQIQQVKVDSLTFTPLKFAAPDAHQRYIVTQDILGFKTGQRIKLTPKEDDAFDKVMEAIEDVGSFFVDSINRVSDAWATIKSTAVSFVADKIPGCSDTCRAGLNAAVDYGLTCAGIPPTLPDFDQLCEMGKGHIVGVLTDEANKAAAPVPVPREMVEQAVDEFLNEVKKTANHGANGSSWLRPDPDYQYRESRLILEMVNTGIERSPAFEQTISHPLFIERTIPIPSLAPGERVSIPVLMEQEIKRLLIPDYKKKTGNNVTMDWQDEVAQIWWDKYYNEQLILEFGNQMLAKFIPGQGI